MHSIMLLDDEPLVLAALVRTIRQHLGDDKVTVTPFTDPFEALAQVQIHHFDVALSDFRMPKMDGVDFLFAVRELSPDTVRIVLSGLTDFSTVSHAISQAQIFRYIAKPWETDDLVASLQAAMAEHDSKLEQKNLAERQRQLESGLSEEEVAARQLEEEEPGLLKVRWGPNGEIIL